MRGMMSLCISHACLLQLPLYRGGRYLIFLTYISVSTDAETFIECRAYFTLMVKTFFLHSETFDTPGEITTRGFVCIWPDQTTSKHSAPTGVSTVTVYSLLYTHLQKNSCTQKESTHRYETWWVGLTLWDMRKIHARLHMWCKQGWALPVWPNSPFSKQWCPPWVLLLVSAPL